MKSPMVFCFLLLLVFGLGSGAAAPLPGPRWEVASSRLRRRMLQRGAAQFRSWCGWGKPCGVSFSSHRCGHGPWNSRADTPYHVSFWYDPAYASDRDSKPTPPDWVGEWSAYVYDDESDARAKPDLDAVHEPNDSAETSMQRRLQLPRV